MSEPYKRKPNIKCSICGKEIYRRPFQINSGSVFCGLVCRGISYRKEKPCTICKKPILSSLNKKTCSRDCANIQRADIKYHLGSPRDKVKYQKGLKLRLLKERGKKCERCNYSKYEILQVHHKDKNRNHNELDNLELICPNCHFEEHLLEKSWLRKKIEKKYNKVY